MIVRKENIDSGVCNKRTNVSQGIAFIFPRSLSIRGKVFWSLPCTVLLPFDTSLYIR